MRNDVIDVQLVEEQIISCPRCGQRNRVHKQQRKVGYRCGACRTELPNPFAVRRAYPRSFSAVVRGFQWSKHGFGLAFFGILAVVVLAFLFSPSDTGTTSHHPPLDATPPASRYLPPPRSLPTGAVLSRISHVGNGTLTIDNGTRHDAVIKVVDETARQTVVAFYVAGGSAATIEHIPDGHFRVIFATGTDWDSALGTFTRDKSFARFDKPLDFVTTWRPRGYDVYMEYSVFTLTLHPIVHGNARTTAIAEEEFVKY